MSTSHFNTLLVANRGEIALRIMKTARRMGIDTVAVYSEADRDSPHVAFADHAVCIGPPAPRESYLNIPALVDAAIRTGAQAVHPGYGFLAENASFARAVVEAGLCFVGPSAEAIDVMGNKAGAKQRMLAAGVPCIPGFQGGAQELQAFNEAAIQIGFPIMVKAAAGGGGRGMRLVTKLSDLEKSLTSARSEALSAFGSAELILERAIADARHIEVQVFADSLGNVVHLGERDCSVQRRHQKLIEESPSPAVDEALRSQMGEVSVVAAKAIQYCGAGTIEYLLAPSGEFFFMEMNTRLQVEHGVTELRTGLDLVEWQLNVASGLPLPLTQKQIEFQGHAMEVRLCSEAPDLNFMPQTGRVLAWDPAEGVRIDAAMSVGMKVEPYYDSMLAKILVSAESRRQCVSRLSHACRHTVLLGVRHNLSFLNDCLQHPEFGAGNATTSFISRFYPSGKRATNTPPAAVLVAAALLYSSAHSGDAWTNTHALGSRVTFSTMSSSDETPVFQCAVFHQGNLIEMQMHTGDDVTQYTIAHVSQKADSIGFEMDHMRHRVRHSTSTDHVLWVHYEGRQYRLRNETFSRRSLPSSGRPGASAVRAPFAGRILRIAVELGADVRKGTVLIVLESMKMEHALEAPEDGKIFELPIAAGDQVPPGQVLVRLGAVSQVMTATKI